MSGLKEKGMIYMTNAMIIELYKTENGIKCPLHTYSKWKSLGYQVKKGEKSEHRITIWKGCTKKVHDEESNVEIVSSKVIMKTACFFTIHQVEKI